jgi:glycosyl hydrolase family 20
LEGLAVVTKRRWINAVMIDCVRITERYDYYLRLIPRLARWGVNMIFWHFTDDQGCALRLASHPELSSRYALSRGETERLIRLARRHGIEVVPEVESLGHCQWITRLPQYAHLFEGSSGHFNALCPSHTESLRLIGDVIAEVAEIFPSPWLHVGLDEVQFGPCPRCRRRGLPEWRLFADHVETVHQIVTASGKRMVLWGDHLVKDPRIARRVPTDSIVAHWDYFTHNPVEADNRTLMDMGFEVLACPASARVFTTVIPDASNLANLRDFARVARKHRHRGVIGYVNTAWCPERQLGSTTHWPMALGAALAETARVDEAALAREFVRTEYGIARPASVAVALRALYETAPGLLRLRRVFVENLRKHPDNEHYRITPADVTDAAERREALAKIASTLQKARGRVTRNKSEFGVYLKAVQILDEALGRFGMWQDASALDRVRRSAVARKDLVEARRVARDIRALLLSAARDARRSATIAERDWKRVRRAADPRRTGRDGSAGQRVALPGLLDRTATVLERLAERAKTLARTGRGSLGLPAPLIEMA